MLKCTHFERFIKKEKTKSDSIFVTFHTEKLSFGQFWTVRNRGARHRCPSNEEQAVVYSKVSKTRRILNTPLHVSRSFGVPDCTVLKVYTTSRLAKHKMTTKTLITASHSAMQTYGNHKNHRLPKEMASKCSEGLGYI